MVFFFFFYKISIYIISTQENEPFSLTYLHDLARAAPQGAVQRRKSFSNLLEFVITSIIEHLNKLSQQILKANIVHLKSNL